MKNKLTLFFAALLFLGGLVPVTAKADTYDRERDHRVVVERDRPHVMWVRSHFVWVHGHRVFWVPGHPGVR